MQQTEQDTLYPPLLFHSLTMDSGYVPQVILNLTLEIICLLTGEDYMVVRKLSSDFKSPGSHPSGSPGLRRNLNPIMELDPPSVKRTRNKDTILKLTNKIIELLTGEVPIRSQDVAVYLSMEERDYLEEHKELYKDAMMDDQSFPPFMDGSRSRNTPERSLCPCDSKVSTQEGPRIPHHYQDENRAEYEDTATAEEIYSRSVLQYKEEEVSPDIKADEEHCSSDPQAHFFISPDDEIKDVDIMADSLGDHPFMPVFCPVLPSTAPCSDPSPSSPDHSDHVPGQPACQHPEKFQCFECGQYFSKGQLLSCPRCQEGKPLSCPVCRKCFTKPSRLVRHELTHTRERPFSCSECGKCYTERSRLARHQMTHSGVTPFLCSDCGKCFMERSQFVRHRRTHTGERPYCCSECGKCFSQKTTLITHQRRHTGEKPYTCLECGKCFTDNSALSKHIRIHNGERPFSCSECGKSFTQKISLVKHQKIHMGD